jgi:hypothetical protein
MKLEHHDLDIHPIPKEKTPLFINEPWLIKEFIVKLEGIPDGCAEIFPFELIDGSCVIE